MVDKHFLWSTQLDSPFLTKKKMGDEQEEKAKLIKERKAWIGYDFANSCYATVAIATFLPLVLNAYAEAEAWRGKTKPQTCSNLEEEYSEKCMECRVGEGNLLCSGTSKGWFLSLFTLFSVSLKRSQS